MTRKAARRIILSKKHVATDDGPPASVEVDLFIISGQSNAEGRGTTSGTGVAGTGYYYKGSGTSFPDLADPVGGAADGSAWPAFASMWFTLTGRKGVFVEQATSGAYIVSGHSPTFDPATADLYPAVIAATNSAIAAIAGHSAFHLNGTYMLWIQGEAESGLIDSSTITQAAYETALTALFNQFKTDIPTLDRIWVSENGAHDDGTTETGFAALRAAQATVCAAIPTIATLVFKGAKNFPYRGQMHDNVHYSTGGLNVVGKGMAVGAYANLLALTETVKFFINGTDTSPWAVPAKVYSINVVDCIAGGATGGSASVAPGGGGGAFARSEGLVVQASSYPFAVGAASNVAEASNGNDTVWGDTTIGGAGVLVAADKGRGSSLSSGGVAGSAGNSKGFRKFSGGAGGQGSTNGGGGGGAGGPNGAGGAGVSGATTGNGGAGDAGSGGAGGTGGAPGSNASTNGTEYDSTHGSGGGGGGRTTSDGTPAATLGLYGGGGGGARNGTSRPGAAGLIRIAYFQFP